MSLRWIQANREAPTCDEESSDIDDSDHSDDNYDSDLFHNEEEDYKKITRHQDNGSVELLLFIKKFDYFFTTFPNIRIFVLFDKKYKYQIS